MKLIVLRVLIVAAFVCITTSVNAAKNEMPSGDFKSMTATSKGRVVEIIDPLTIRLDDDSIVSLTGLDYPDLDYYQPGNFAIMTLKIMKDFLLDQDVTLYQTKNDGLGRINRMGHQLGHLVRRDGVWAQGLMLSLGLARVRTTGSNTEMAAQMYDLENTARDSKAGIWNVQGYKIIPADAADAAIGSYSLIEGEIIKTAMQKNRLYLNFGKDWRSDFTISIAPRYLKIFNAEGINPQKWGRKRIRVRGWVENFNGPYIEVDHPQQIEILFERDPVSEDKEPEDETTSSNESESGLP